MYSVNPFQFLKFKSIDKIFKRLEFSFHVL